MRVKKNTNRNENFCLLNKKKFFPMYTPSVIKYNMIEINSAIVRVIQLSMERKSETNTECKHGIYINKYTINDIPAAKVLNPLKKNNGIVDKV